MTTGSKVEQELRKQQAERNGSGGMSTALAEAVVAWACGDHLDADPADIIEIFGPVLRKMLGPLRDRRLRDIIRAAQHTRGRRVILHTHLFWFRTQAEFDAEAQRFLSQTATEAQADHESNRSAKAITGATGGRPITFEAHLRDKLVQTAATSKNPDKRLKQANDALVEAGFATISARTLRLILTK